jgi:hypothetical protein
MIVLIGSGLLQDGITHQVEGAAVAQLDRSKAVQEPNACDEQTLIICTNRRTSECSYARPKHDPTKHKDHPLHYPGMHFLATERRLYSKDWILAK